MTKGQNYSIQILVARDLNLKPSCTNEAENYLKTGSINPVMILHFSNEAYKMVKLINQKNLVSQAFKLSNKYTTNE